MGTPKHEGTLPAARDYVRFDNEHIRMTALKKAEDRDTAILRLFNTTAEAVTLTAKVASTFQAAKLTNLNEAVEADLPLTDGELVLEIPPKKILTVELA